MDEERATERKVKTYLRKVLMIMVTYLKKFFNEGKDILEKVSYVDREISEKVFDKSEDILEEVSDNTD